VYESGGYRADNPTWHLEDARWKADHVAGILRRNSIVPSSIADIGCGVGGVVAELRGLGVGAEHFGFDISPDAITEARSRRGDGIEFVVGYPAAGQRFALAMLLDVLEHVHDPFALLDTARQASDHVVAHIPLELSVVGALRPSAFLRARSMVGHITYFCKETAIAMFEEVGLEIVATELTAAAIDLPGGGLKRRVARTPRRLVNAASPDVAARLLGGFSALILARSRS